MAFAQSHLQIEKILEHVVPFVSQDVHQSRTQDGSKSMTAIFHHVRDLTLVPMVGGGGIFIPHHQTITCHSETPLAMAPKLCDFLFSPFCHMHYDNVLVKSV